MGSHVTQVVAWFQHVVKSINDQSSNGGISGGTRIFRRGYLKQWHTSRAQNSLRATPIFEMIIV